MGMKLYLAISTCTIFSTILDCFISCKKLYIFNQIATFGHFITGCSNVLPSFEFFLLLSHCLLDVIIKHADRFNSIAAAL